MPTSLPPVIELVGVRRRFPGPGPEGGPLDVLSGVDLAVDAGSSLGILGPSGSGKSTLLHILGTLDLPDEGRVIVHGTEVTSLGEEERASLRSREIGFVFQEHLLLPQCTVLENVLVPTLLTRPDPGSAAEHARKLLDRAGLSGRLHHRPGEISGGERQRAAVVRALINRPRLVIADEPTGSLDPATASVLGELLIGVTREEGAALVVATHSGELAGRLDRVFRLAGGVLTPVACPLT